MKRSRITHLCILLVAPLVAAALARADLSAAGPLTKSIPADLPFVMVIGNPEAFDAAALAFVRQIDPSSGGSGPLSDLKATVPNGDWVDFSKPLAMAAPAVGAEPSIFWVAVPDFAEKVKELEGASEADGVWTVPFGAQTCYVKKAGGFLAVATSSEQLAAATRSGPSLADALKGREAILKDRGMLLHLDLVAQRPMMQQGLQQAGMMAPMMAMQLAQGGDPTQITNMLNGLVQGVQRFVEQLKYVDITANVTKDDLRLTIASGFEEGPIHSFIAKTKPGKLGGFRDVEGGTFAFALDSHLPGGIGEVGSYLMSKMFVTTEPDSEIAKMVADAKELAALTDGMTLVMQTSGEGIKVNGAYRASNPARFQTLMIKSMENPNPLQKQMAAGMTYESAGTEKVGGTEVTKYTMKFDESNPAAGQMQMLYGTSATIALGQVGDRVRYCMGSESDISKTFTPGTSNPLGGSKFVQSALDALPAERNSVILIDPMGFLPMVPPMFMPPIDTSKIAPGPVIGVSISLSGEPARLDVHVPVQAILRVIQAMQPQEPM